MDGAVPAVLPERSAIDGSRPASTSRPRTGVLYYNAGVDPDARDLSPGVLMVYAVRRAGDGARARARSTSCAATSPTSTSGARSTSPIQRLLVRRDGRERMTPRPRRIPASRSSRARRCSGGADPRRRGPRHRHERRRPGAPVLARDAGWITPATTSRSCRCRRGVPSASCRRRASRSSSSTSRMTPSPSARSPRTSPRSGRRSSTTTCTARRPSARGPRWPSPRSASAGRMSSPRSTRAASAPRRTASSCAT